MSSAAEDLKSALDGLPVRVVDVHDTWPSLRIGRTVPLGRLEWLWTLRGASVRDSSTSAKAVFNVTSSTTLSEPSTPQLVHEWFRKSYLHILIVTISELHVSRESPGWTRVRVFVDACRERHLEYLVLCVADDNAVRTHRKVLEKLRAEVNLTTRGRERVVTVPTAAIKEELKPISHLHHSPAHQDLLVRLRECARDGVEACVQAYEAEAGRSFANRMSSAWSFSSFFSLKEGMSFVFVQIGRRDLALRCYDELAAVMAERDERGTRGFCCGTDQSDAAIGVVDPFAKEFRRMIIDNDIAELDFRTYLFSRQVTLLLMDRKYSEVAERGLKFITAIARRAAEEANREGSTLSPVFRDAWVFCAARALAGALAPAIPSSAAAANALSKQLGTARERHTARLIAGFHVHALKAFSGLAQLALPGKLVASMDPAEVEVDTEISPQLKEALAGMSSDMLRNALSEASKAVELYSEMANAAASLYEMGGRARGAAALDGDAGVVRLRNDSLVLAEELLSAQCSRFTEDHGWDQLHIRRRVELASAEKQLNRVQEYLVSCLTMLFMTRGRRRLATTSAPDAQDGDAKAYVDEAERWAREAKAAAEQLPRVMKYKAEKLVLVRLRANDEPWNEGDPGSATVVVESDIPADLKVDSVYVELRWVAASNAGREGHVNGRPAVAPSALHRTDADGGSVADDANLSSPVAVSPAKSGGDLPETLVLNGKGSLVVGVGETTVEVFADEIPRSGRYVVTQVALVVGRLKLVQSAAKAPTVPTVTTKGSTSAKVPSAALAASAAQTDPGSNKVRFPCYFANQRPESATVAIEHPERLFLMPKVVQYASVIVTAGRNGLAKGGRLSMVLSSARGAPGSNGQGNCFVQLVAGDGGDSGSLKVTPDTSGSCAEFEVPKELQKGETYTVRIPMRVAEDLSRIGDHGSSVAPVSEGRASFLQVSLACTELASSRSYVFACHCDQRLPFVNPLHVSARIELSGGGGDEIPRSSAGGDFEYQLTGGGMLLCSLKSRAGVGKSVTLKSVSLELPPWLELHDESTLPYTQLLPYRIRNNGTFSVAFDTSVRAIASDRTSTQEARVGRALSRVGDHLDDEEGEGGDEIREKGVDADGRPRLPLHDESGSLLDLEDVTRRAKRGGDVSLDSSSGSSVGDDRAPVAQGNGSGAGDVAGVKQTADAPTLSLEQIDVHDRPLDGEVRLDGAGEGAGRTGRRLDVGGIRGAGHSVRVRDPSGEVVDLSDSARHFRDAVSPTAGVLPGGMEAVLRVEVEVDGVSGPSTLEQPISMHGFRPHRRRYRIERMCAQTVTVGQSVVLRFQVGVIAPSTTGYEEAPEATVLHYEIAADSREWIIAGRRRGQIVVSGAEGDIGRATVIALTPGRLYVPTIRLYERDGCSLNPSRYENVNKGSQVIVLPPSLTVSSCTSEPIPAAGTGGAQVMPLARSHSVATVNADAFFS